MKSAEGSTSKSKDRKKGEKSSKQSLKSLKSFDYIQFIRRTSKLKYNFNLNAIVFNQRLAFDLNPQLHIEDYLMSIQLTAHSVKFCFESGVADQIVFTQTKLPSIIFRYDPIERWFQFDKVS